MSTPASHGPANDDETTSGAAPQQRGRRRRAAASPDPETEQAGTAEVVYLNESEEDRLARIQGRIRTKKGRFLRSMTDLGNTERYMDRYAGDLLFVDESERWRCFNGKHWADTTKDRELQRRVKKVLRDIWSEAEQCRTSADAVETRKWAKESEKKSSITAVKTLLVSDCAVSVEDFDQRGTGADTLNLMNGTLDLETFELRPHAKEDMLSKFSPVVFDPQATAPNWLRHMEWAIPDPATRETVQRYLGYCLTTETREQKMLCFHGSKGRNGKGIIIRQVEAILGYDQNNSKSADYAYAQAAQASLLLSGKRGLDAASPDMADLVGKRFVSLQETKQGEKFDETRLKQLTGGDAIRARFLNQNPFQFTPVAKYVLVTNNRPEVANDDEALWRRLFLVHFPNSISEADRDADPEYEVRIENELSGILNWLLEGLRKWRADGLQISDSIRADTDAYRADQDWFSQFMDDCMEEREAHLVSAATAYAVYQKWAQDSGQGVLAQRRFRTLLGNKIETLYTKKTGNPSEWYYGGLAFREGVVGTFVTARYASNPTQRPDPGSPPAEHTAHYAAERRAAAQRQANAATPTPTPPAAKPVVPVEQLSPQCRKEHHAECARDRAGNWISALDCLCPCHEGDGGEPLPPEYEPTPDLEMVPDLSADELDMLAELDNDGIDPVPEQSEPPRPHDDDAPDSSESACASTDSETITGTESDASATAGPQLFSERRIVPWTVKPSAYVDLGAGTGLLDDGTSFTITQRGRLASLADLLRAVPEGVKFVHLTGAEIGTDSAVLSWANTRLPKGWTLHPDRAADSDDARDRVSLRYIRPDGTQLTIYRAAIWTGSADTEATTSPAVLRDAFALVLAGIGETFGEVVAGEFGVPLKSTPASTGLELIRRTLPRDRKTGAPHRFPILDNDIQHLIRSHAGQARTEDFAALTHPSGGAFVPDQIPGLYVYDMRFAYAALFDLEMPTGPVIRDTTPEFAKRGSGWEPCLYRVRVTVPEGWDRAGRFRTRSGENAVWVYPNQPGESFEAWTWERALHAADRDGWRIGEHVQILERVRFTGPKTKPLAVFGKNLRALRDEWIPSQDAPEPVRELARVMARQIAIAAIGKLSGTPYGKLRSCPKADTATRPAGAWLSEDGRRWEWRELVTGRDYLVHPEWASYIWATCRDWLYDHPAQRGVGLRHVPREQLLAARTDGFWTSSPQPVTDTGRVGHFRVQLAHDEPLATPRTYAELNTTRTALLEAASR